MTQADHPPETLPKVVAIRGKNGPVLPVPQLGYPEPSLFAVIEPEGTLLGEVGFIVTTLSVGFGTGVAWVIQKGIDGQDVLVKYALPGQATLPDLTPTSVLPGPTTETQSRGVLRCI